MSLSPVYIDRMTQETLDWLESRKDLIFRAEAVKTADYGATQTWTVELWVEVPRVVG